MLPSSVSITTVTGVWALGVRLGPRPRQLLVLALLVGVLGNALVAWARALGAPGSLFAYRGGATGLLGNSVYLAALSAAGLWLAYDLVARQGKMLWLLAIPVIAGSAQLSEERSAWR